MTTTRTVLDAVPDSPIACDLPLAEMGGRIREWDRLFAAHLTSVARGPEHLALTLEGPGLDAAGMRDLIEREHACCAFLGFDLREEDGRFALEIRAPEGVGWAIDDIAWFAMKAAPAKQ